MTLIFALVAAMNSRLSKGERNKTNLHERNSVKSTRTVRCGRLGTKLFHFVQLQEWCQMRSVSSVFGGLRAEGSRIQLDSRCWLRPYESGPDPYQAALDAADRGNLNPSQARYCSMFPGRILDLESTQDCRASHFFDLGLTPL